MLQGATLDESTIAASAQRIGSRDRADRRHSLDQELSSQSQSERARRLPAPANFCMTMQSFETDHLCSSLGLVRLLSCLRLQPRVCRLSEPGQARGPSEQCTAAYARDRRLDHVGTGTEGRREIFCAREVLAAGEDRREVKVHRRGPFGRSNFRTSSPAADPFTASNGEVNLTSPTINEQLDQAVQFYTRNRTSRR